MLILSRKRGQKIKLGDSITITVTSVDGDQVRLGIDAPRELLILRDELSPVAQEAAPALSASTVSETLWPAAVALVP